ncbi:bifunctional protein-serine/threonine kinase/phosphatase [Verrucomicrobiaceae bacterium 227]
MHVPGDSLLITKGIAACIADGVSAASAGKEASESCVRGFLNDYYETPETWQVKTAGQRVLTALNRWLVSQGQGYASAEQGCVTTFTALVLKSRTAHVFHIGDSRLWRLRGQELEQLTRDHASRVSPDTTYLTRAMGLNNTPRIDYHTFSVEPGDTFLLTTDGIHDTLPLSKIRQTLLAQPDLLQAANTLGELAQDSTDNRSCLILRIDTLPSDDKDDVFRQLSELPFPPDLLPGQSIDGLVVEKIISATRNTQLYLVHDRHDDHRPLILKTPSITYADDPAYLERFTLEEWIGLRTESPHLVKVIRRTTPRRFLYYTMEPINGPTLTQWSEQHPNPPVDQVIKIIRQLITGVRTLHRRETLHQDLKPDNVLLDENGTVKIIDYGSCRVAGMTEISTPFGQPEALGTIDFSAPEYRIGGTATPASDLFSIAAITYFLLSGGKLPFGPAWDSAKDLHSFLKLNYQSSASHNPMVPLWMDAALKKSLSIRPDSRHPSMSEFLHNLEHPDPNLATTAPLPIIQKNPLLFWKTLSLALLILLVISHWLR